MGLFSLCVLSKSGLTLKHRTYAIMSRGKQSVKKGLWYIRGKYKKARKRQQKGGAIAIGLIASLAAPVLGEIAKPNLGKILGRGRKRRRIRWEIKSL